MYNASITLMAAALVCAAASISGCARMTGQPAPATSQPRQTSTYQGTYVDKRVNRQIQRQQSHINQRITRETNQAVDSAVENALDSIFN